MARNAPLWGSCRLVFACCSFLLLFNAFMQRFSLSFAVVCMGELRWDRVQTERLLAAFFYGYLASQLLAGRLSDQCGGKAPFLLGNAVQSVLALCLPSAADQGPGAVFAVRLLQGVACGFFLPSVFRLFSHWTLPAERTALLAFAYASVPLAFIVTFPLSGFVCMYASWPAIFYTTGVFGTACSLVCYFLVYETADSHPRITENERSVLRAVTPSKTSDKKEKVPYRAMLLSVPVNANHVANFCYNWGFNTVATNLPIFLEEVLEFDVRKNGLYSAMPYIGLLSMRLTIAAGFEQCMQVTGLRLTAMRKLSHTIGAVGAGACVLGVAMLPSSRKYTAVALVTASQTVAELAYTGGFLCSFLDLAPPHVGLLSGWTNAVGAATGLLGPTLIGLLVQTGARDEWNTVLYITAGFYLLGAVVYLLFGSSEIQPWAIPQDEEKNPLLAPSRSTTTSLQSPS